MAEKVAQPADLRVHRISPPLGPTESAEANFWFPVLALLAGFALVVVAGADTAARSGRFWAEPLFWSGLLLLFVPCALRLFSLEASRRERLGVVSLLGAALYVVKLLHDPAQFSFFDEYSNWRTASDILSFHHLYSLNPIEPINARFPALGVLTSSLSSVSGMSLFHSGAFVLGAARLILVVALFLLFERVSGSHRVAGVAVLLYLTNPNFLFFDAQFGYESLSLPICFLALTVAFERATSLKTGRMGLTIVSAFLVSAVVITHHLTTYAMIVFFLAWAAWAVVVGPRSSWGWPASLALVAAVESGLWIAYIAAPVVGYLITPLSAAIGGIVDVLARRSHTKKLNHSYTGATDALWTQMISYLSVLFALAVLPVGLWRIVRRYRHIALALVLAAVSLTYPASLALRFTPQGTETSNRASEFVFVGLGFVLAVAAVEVWGTRRSRWLSLGFALWTSVLFVGGIEVGWSASALLPYSYSAGADLPRALNEESLQAALWASRHLGAGNRILTDRVNRQLMGSYGHQNPQIGVSNGHSIGTLFFLRRFDSVAKSIIHGDAIRYVVVDLRLSRVLPIGGYYFDHDEPGALKHRHPIKLSALTKFNHVPGVSRVYSSGNIAIYDVGRFGGCATNQQPKRCVGTGGNNAP